MRNKKLKRPSESVTIKTEVVCPTDTNPLGILKGGRLVEWMDMAAASSAQIHSGNVCVTAAINNVDFIQAAETGDIILIRAVVTRGFNRSMEIFVQSHAQNVKGQKKNLICEAYFTFVVLNDHGKAPGVTGVKPVTKIEKKQFEQALIRKTNTAEIKAKMRNEVYDSEGQKIY